MGHFASNSPVIRPDQHFANLADRTPYILTACCPNRPGLVASVAGAIHALGGNIVETAQHNDRSTQQFFMRVLFRAVRYHRQSRALLNGQKTVGFRDRQPMHLLPYEEFTFRKRCSARRANKLARC